jgi:hypothetical protein
VGVVTVLGSFELSELAVALPRLPPVVNPPLVWTENVQLSDNA